MTFTVDEAKSTLPSVTSIPSDSQVVKFIYRQVFS
jgi:hypothetical protein